MNQRHITRAAIGVIAFAALFRGEALAGDWLSWLTFPTYQPHHSAGPGPAGHDMESPLSPVLAPYLLENSQCKMPWCTHARPKHGHHGASVDPYPYPPLPYGHRPGPVVMPADGMAPPAALAPAPTPAPPAAMTAPEPPPMSPPASPR